MVDRRRAASTPLPLFAWLEQSRAARDARDRRRRLAWCAALAAVPITAVILTVALPPSPRLVWNASASAPIGLYRIAPGAPIARGDIVLVWLPREARALAAARHYLPGNVPAVKRVAAIGGDRVCAAGDAIAIDGRRAARRRATDARGRTLPQWSGCRPLRNDELFLLNPDADASFDSRYFGPVARGNLIGKATLSWSR